jgi:hypothetical protein
MITETEQRRRKAISASKTKHGHAGSMDGSVKRSMEYHIWSAMIQRCTKPSHKDYARYGGSGITVCDEWRDFSRFISDMGERPSMVHTIERMNNVLGYGPGNCRWATRKEQARNRSSTIWTTVDGVQCTLTEACAKLGVSYGMVRGRLRLGWTIDDALSVPKSSNTRARV